MRFLSQRFIGEYDPTIGKRHCPHLLRRSPKYHEADCAIFTNYVFIPFSPQKTVIAGPLKSMGKM